MASLFDKIMGWGGRAVTPTIETKRDVRLNREPVIRRTYIENRIAYAEWFTENVASQPLSEQDAYQAHRILSYIQYEINRGYIERYDVPSVCNIRNDFETIYIGRRNRSWEREGSIWANPYKVGDDGSLDEVLNLYRSHVLTNRELLFEIPNLRGHILGCWCKPKGCHGDVLAEIYTEWVFRTYEEFGPSGFNDPQSRVTHLVQMHLQAKGW